MNYTLISKIIYFILSNLPFIVGCFYIIAGIINIKDGDDHDGSWKLLSGLLGIFCFGACLLVLKLTPKFSIQALNNISLGFMKIVFSFMVTSAMALFKSESKKEGFLGVGAICGFIVLARILEAVLPKY